MDAMIDAMLEFSALPPAQGLTAQELAIAQGKGGRAEYYQHG